MGKFSFVCCFFNLDLYYFSIMKFMKDFGKFECKGEIYLNFKGDIFEVKGKGIFFVKYRII